MESFSPSVSPSSPPLCIASWPEFPIRQGVGKAHYFQTIFKTGAGVGGRVGVGKAVWDGREWLFLNYHRSPCISPKTPSFFSKVHSLQTGTWGVERWTWPGLSRVSALGHPHTINSQAALTLTPTCKIPANWFSPGLRPLRRDAEGSWYPDENKDQTRKTSAHVDSWSCEIYVTSELGALISTPTKSAAEVSPPSASSPFILLALSVFCCCCCRISQGEIFYLPFSDY